MQDLGTEFVARIKDAAASGKALCLRGGGSKDFYGQEPVGEVLDTRPHAGILSYEPTELVITARSGTPLSEIEAVLAEQGQMLAFEAPHFGVTSPAPLPPAAGEGSVVAAPPENRLATLGGCVAAGLSGPRRAAVGAVRDFVLGTVIADGRGEIQRFGGQVMKNVAGYDVARLMAGSLGTLGLLLEISVKVLPRPVAEKSLRLEMAEAEALAAMNRWAGQPIPISATCWRDGTLTVRLSGARAAVDKARRTLGGEVFEPADGFWAGLREQSDAFFDLGEGEGLWRLSVPSTAPALNLPGQTLIEWGGAQRWQKGTGAAGGAPDARRVADAAGGHATLFRGGSAEQRRAVGVFHPLAPAMAAVQKRLKQAFDPAGILNPGRMYL
ncbi:MAG: glycolate oxidase subunit GlcE [Rhodocyclaceae bacterium]|nr:glycolate oxidase subunit GlcE [Rhodocyclaceae bacterium]